MDMEGMDLSMGNTGVSIPYPTTGLLPSSTTALPSFGSVAVTSHPQGRMEGSKERGRRIGKEGLGQ
jgi:hypothetical protein